MNMQQLILCMNSQTTTDSNCSYIYTPNRRYTEVILLVLILYFCHISGE